jgi:REP-associated tyrosine transposase
VQVSAGGVGDFGYHVVWCPKYRRPVLGGPVAARGEEPIRVEAAGHGWRMVALEITPDHVHLVVKAHRCDSPSRTASQVKGFTSRYLRAEFAHLRSRLSAWWSRWYIGAMASAVLAQTVSWYTGTLNGRRWRKERAR